MDLLRTQAQNLPASIKEPLVYILGPQCFKTLVLEGHVSDAPCLQFALSKGLSLGMVAGGGILKIPQILAILSAKSARGLSMTSYLLDTASLVIFDAYNIKLGFPLISYAENIAILAQNVIIVTLILSLGTSAARTSSSLPIPTLLAFYILVAASLYSLCYLTPLGLLKSLFTLSIPLSVLSKIPQIISNARSGSTGQLSAFLVFASLAGTAARVYTTSQETGDTLLFFNYALGAALNSILAVQLGIYRSNTLSASQKAKSEPIELRSVAPPPQPAAVPTPTPLQQSQRIPGSTPSKSTSVQPGSRASPVAARSTRTPSKQWVRKAD